MLFLKYTRYFFYLGFKFSFRVAIHIIKAEIKGEKKYKINTSGIDKLKQLEKKGIDTDHASIYMPASYDVLEEIFEILKKENLFHLTDIGCGKGRAMVVAAHYGFRKLTGIDISKELCTDARENLENIKQSFPFLQYKIVNNDAFYFEIPDDSDCIFLFNPFDEVIMSAVINNIEESRVNFPRPVFIVYFNAIDKHMFLEAGYKEIFNLKKLEYLDGCILKK